MAAIPQINPFKPYVAPLPDQLSAAEEVARALGGAKKTVNGYDCRCPSHDDNKASLSVSNGGDKLLFTCHAGCDQRDVADAIKGMGFTISSRTTPRIEIPEVKPASPGVFKPPAGTAPPTIDECKTSGQKPVALYYYRDQDGEIINAVARYESNGVKTFLPWSWNGRTWVCKQLPEGERHLYNLHLTRQRPDASIVVVEGEKCADALQSILGDEYVVLTWAGGAKAVDKTDWSPIKGRKILIWGDADEAGEKAAQRAAEVHDGLSRVIKIETNRPKGWDAADAIADGWTKDRLVNFIAAKTDDKAPSMHPLASFVDYHTQTIDPVVFVIDGVIEEKITLVAGSAGVGKTTQLIPLLMRCTHLVNDDQMQPSIRRRVVYVAEDVRQASRVISSMRRAGEITCSEEELRDWFRIVEARRMKADQIVKVAEVYEHLAHMNHGDSGMHYNAPPLVVFDTGSSSFELDNESDNSEVAAAIAVLKQRFGNFPIIIVLHIAKAMKRANLADYSARGAGAWEGDAQQVTYLVKEDDGTRWLEIENAKHRFGTKVAGIKFEATINKVMTKDVLGKPQEVVLIHGVPSIVERDDRKQAKQEAQEREKKEVDAEMRQALMDSIRRAWSLNNPLSARAALDTVTGNQNLKSRLLQALKNERWVCEVALSKQEKERLGHSRQQKTVLYCMNTEEHWALVNEGVIPVSIVEKGAMC
jgi:DNA primase